MPAGPRLPVRSNHGGPVRPGRKGRRLVARAEELEPRQLLAFTGTLSAAMDPATDSGASAADAVTNIDRPRFFGTAPAGALVTLYARADGTGPAIPLGSAVADAAGAWGLQAAPLADGSYSVVAVAEGAGGSGPAAVPVLPAGARGLLTIDTAGPEVSEVRFLPSTGRIQVTFAGDPGGADPAAVLDRSDFTLTRIRRLPGAPQFRHPGPRYAISGVYATPPATPGGPLLALVSVENNRPIGNGVYRLSIRTAGVTDPAGNPPAGAIAADAFVATLTRIGPRVAVATPQAPRAPFRVEIPPARTPTRAFGNPLPIPVGRRAGRAPEARAANRPGRDRP